MASTSTISLYSGYNSGSYGDANVIALFSNYQYPIYVNNSITATGNVSGNVIVGNAFYWGNGVNLLNTLYSNVNVAGYLPTYSGNIGGTLLTAAQPHITAVGPLVNLTAASNVSMDGYNINFLANPTQPTDAATKAYVDNLAQGLSVKVAVNLTTTGPLPGYTYYNGPANDGVGATLTGLSLGQLTIDGFVAQPNSRVLIKDEVSGNAPYNGIYLVTRNGVGTTYQLTRATDMDVPQDIYGSYTYTVSGIANIGTSWINTNTCTNPITIGTTAITFTEFVSGGTFIAGTGININTGVINALVDNTTVRINGLNQIYASGNFPAANIVALTASSATVSGNLSAGNITTSSISVTGSATSSSLTTGAITSTGLISTTGNVQGAYVKGNGSQLTGMYGNSNVIAFLPTYAGNIGGMNMTLTGNIVANNITGNISITTTNDFGANNIFATGVVSAVGNIRGGNLNTTGNVNAVSVNATGIISTTGNIYGGNVSVSGNVIGQFFEGVATSAQYADLAEMYLADRPLQPGTVVEVGGSAEVRATTSRQSTAIAGIVSTNPSYLMNSAIQGEFPVAVALLGRVPCQVVGTIRKGDILVSSPIEGVATSSHLPTPGSIIGKALEDYDSFVTGTIEVLVGRV